VFFSSGESFFKSLHVRNSLSAKSGRGRDFFLANYFVLSLPVIVNLMGWILLHKAKQLLEHSQIEAEKVLSLDQNIMFLGSFL
jgi:hypothetical protein